MPARSRGAALAAVAELAEMGPALPHNIGAARAVSEEIKQAIEQAALRDHRVVTLLEAFIKESGMNGPEGGEVSIELHLFPELRITGSSLSGLAEKPKVNGHRKRA